jgi:hypothetical protein
MASMDDNPKNAFLCLVEILRKIRTNSIEDGLFYSAAMSFYVFNFFQNVKSLAISGKKRSKKSKKKPEKEEVSEELNTSPSSSSLDRKESITDSTTKHIYEEFCKIWLITLKTQNAVQMIFSEAEQSQQPGTAKEESWHFAGFFFDVLIKSMQLKVLDTKDHQGKDYKVSLTSFVQRMLQEKNGSRKTIEKTSLVYLPVSVTLYSNYAKTENRN